MMDTHSVILNEPIARENSEISGRCWERNRNHWTARDFDSTNAPSGLVEGKGRKVKEATNLIDPYCFLENKKGSAFRERERERRCR